MKIELNIIYNMDCLEGMAHIPDQSVDMVLCDLPYGVTRNIWDAIIPLDKLWLQYRRIIKNSGVIVLTGTQPFTSSLVTSNLDMFRYSLVWRKSTKTGFLNAQKMPMRGHEDILVFYKKLPTYNPIKTSGHDRKRCTRGALSSNYGAYKNSSYDSTDRFPYSILEFSNANQREKVHPTQKPVALFEYLIKTYTNEDDTVLDNCMGSGTTAIACHNTNRNFIGFETEQKYVDAAYGRLCQLL